MPTRVGSARGSRRVRGAALLPALRPGLAGPGAPLAPLPPRVRRPREVTAFVGSGETKRRRRVRGPGVRVPLQESLPPAGFRLPAFALWQQGAHEPAPPFPPCVLQCASVDCLLREEGGCLRGLPPCHPGTLRVLLLSALGRAWDLAWDSNRQTMHPERGLELLLVHRGRWVPT